MRNTSMPADVRESVTRVDSVVRAVCGDRPVSTYVHGSLALGGFNPGQTLLRSWNDLGMDAIDYELIRQLLGRYNLAIDLGDAEGWAATFTPDGVFRCTGLPDGSPLGGRYEGTDELVAYAKTHYGIAKGLARHWNANLLIEGDGETATMRCYLLALTAGSGKLAGTTGIYEDRLRKFHGEWRFVERHIAIDEVATRRDPLTNPPAA